jgi:UDP-N-acetylglucosamine 4-epimerase
VNELYADVFAKTYGIELIGLRYFNVFGPRQNPDGAYAAVLPKWTIQILRHEEITINGDGSISRDFTYVENVMQANLLATLFAEPFPESKVFNVACGKRTSLEEVIKMILQAVQIYNSEIIIKKKYCKERAGDIHHSHASIEKIRNQLAYEPCSTIEEGMQRLVFHIANKLKR